MPLFTPPLLRLLLFFLQHLHHLSGPPGLRLVWPRRVPPRPAGQDEFPRPRRNKSLDLDLTGFLSSSRSSRRLSSLRTVPRDLELLTRSILGPFAGERDIRHHLEPTQREADIPDATEELARAAALARADPGDVRPAGRQRQLGGGIVHGELGEGDAILSLLVAVIIQLDGQDALAHDARVVRADGQLLPDVAALAEVDAAHHVHVAFERQGGLAVDLALALGDAVQHAPQRVRREPDLLAGQLRFVGEMGAEVVRAGRDDAGAEPRRAGVNAAENGRGVGEGRRGVGFEVVRGPSGLVLVIPGGPDGAFAVLEGAEVQLRAELVFLEVFQEIRHFVLVHLDDPAGFVGGRSRSAGRRIDERIVQHPSLRVQESGVACRPPCRAIGVIGNEHVLRDQALQEGRAVLAGDGDEAAIRESNIAGARRGRGQIMLLLLLAGWG